MKKLFFLLSLFLISMLTKAQQTEEKVVDLSANLTFGISNGVAYVKGVSNPDGVPFNLTVPTKYLDKNVTFVGVEAFKDTKLVSITFLGNLQRIEERAFQNCHGLKKVEFPDGQLLSIGYQAFHKCENLENIGDISEVETIKSQIFYECKKLKRVNLSQKCKGIMAHSFESCIALESVGDLSNVEFIGSAAFSACTNLKNGEKGINIVSVKELYDPYNNELSKNAFAGCSSLEEIQVSSKLKVIPKNCFYGCSKLKTVYYIDGTGARCIPEFTTIGVGAFMNCSSLEWSPVLDKATSIENNAFEGCTNMRGWQLIGNNSNGEDVYGKITFSPNLTKLGDYAFKGCEKIYSVVFSENPKITTIGSNMFENCTGLRSVSMSSQIDSIAIKAFMGCSSLPSITISNQIRIIDENAFNGCVALKNVTFPKEDGSLKKISVGAFENCGIIEAILPHTIESIRGHAFAGCTNLVNVQIPNRLKEIETKTFAGCTSLNNIELPESVKEIYDCAFWGCTNLVSCNASTTKLVKTSVDTFSGCKCKGVTYPSNNPSNSRNRASANSEITGIILPITIEEIGEGTFDGCPDLEVVELPDNVRVIGKRAFANCPKLESIDMKNKVGEIGERAFANCSKLKTIVIPSSVKKVEGNAFLNTPWYDSQPDGLIYLGRTAYKYKGRMNTEMSITIKDSTEHIGAEAFLNCRNLVGITMPSSIKSIGESAFQYCGFTYVCLPEKVESIEYRTFSGCESLSSIAIPSKVKTINSYAFYNCSNLKDIYMFCETPPTINGWGVFDETAYANVTIHVPTDCEEVYRAADTWKNFSNIVEEELDWASITTQLKPEIDINYYYLYHPVSGKYITVANGRWAQADLSYAGRAFYIRNKEDGYVIKCDSYYLGWEDYSMGSSETKWHFIKQEDGNYALTGDNTQYLYYDVESSTLKKGNDPTNPNAHWKLLTKENFINSMADANMDNPYDASTLIDNPEFVYGETSWQGSPTIGGNSENRCAEKFSCTFDVYQTMKGLPNGFYKLKVQGFYREGSIANSVAMRKSISEEINAVVYANNKEKPLCSIFDEADNCENAFVSDLGKIPNTMEHASSFFSKDLYWNEVTAEVTDGTLRVGVRSNKSVSADWACFDSFLLYYYGQDNPTPITIKAKSYTREYGEPNPTFDYTTDGPSFEGTPEISCEATATSPVGTYDIIVKKGTVNADKLELVKGKLVITKAPLTITAGNYTMKQGDDMPAWTPTFTGFKNNETAEVLTKQPVFTCNATSTSSPGEYPITIAGAEATNYDISYQGGKLTIVKADAVIVKAKSYTREYGDPNPVFEYVVEGGELNGTPEISCKATATSRVGTYEIQVGKGTVKNYNVSFVAGELTVTQAKLTVSVGNYTRKKGEENPTFIITYSGWKNSENESVLSSKARATTTAKKSSPAGEYPITVSGASARNYDFEYINGMLIVTEPDPEPEMAKDVSGIYYIYNPASGKYLTGANYWGTCASLGEVGVDFQLEKADDKNGMLVDSKYYLNNTNHYLGWPILYIDQPAAVWYFYEQKDGTFVMTADNKKYLAYDGMTTILDTIPYADSSYAHWQLMTRQDIIAQMAGATKNRPVDVSSLIAYPDFGRSGTRRNTESWNDYPTIGGKVENYCAEKYNCTFDVNQTLIDLPNGHYKVKVQGFYRDGAYQSNTVASVVEKRRNGNENLNALLYANGAEKPLMSMFEEVDNCSEGYETELGIVPNTQAHASSFFSAGLYWNEVETNVKDGILKIGIKKSVAVTNDWTCFDSFRLYYYGDAFGDDENSIKDNCLSRGDSFDVYTVEGRKVRHQVNTLEGLPKGVYIIAGKKVVIK